MLHFAEPAWFFGLIAIPFAAWGFFKSSKYSMKGLEAFIDAHLLPFLIIDHTAKKNSLWKNFLMWSLCWACLILALAGPRWSFREVETLVSGKSIVVILDLSESMNATDVKPSRMAVARQKIEDIINHSDGIKIGLIGFAADSHMIFPLTEDMGTIRRLLPSIGTELVYRQGSKIAPALKMAFQMLENEPGQEKSILIISDGGFNDALASSVKIDTIGVGTVQGAPLKDPSGVIRKKNGTAVLSKLDESKLREISKMGNGRYYGPHEEFVINGSSGIASEKKERIWDEQFYVFLLPVLPIFLWWFRRGHIAACFLLMFTPATNLMGFSQYFKNSEELGKEAFDTGDYESAQIAFEDPYRKGVAHYRAGDYKKASEMFEISSRKEVGVDATYNQGNALALEFTEESLRKSVEAYNDVLKKQPEHEKAKHNLVIVTKLLKEHEQKQKDEQDKPNQDKQDQDDPKKDQDKGEDKDEDEDKEQNEPPKDNPEPKPQESPPPDENAEFLLNRIQSDPKDFLKNKFYVETMKNGTREEVDPW